MNAAKLKAFLPHTLLFVAIGVYLSLALWHIGDPFFRVSEDTNGVNGLAARNWVRFGLLASIFAGGLIGWFYYFMPIAIFTFLLALYAISVPDRGRFLGFILALLAAAESSRRQFWQILKEWFLVNRFKRV